MPKELILAGRPPSQRDAATLGNLQLSHDEWSEKAAGSFHDECFSAVRVTKEFFDLFLAAADRHAFQRFLKEVFRVLKPGGILTLPAALNASPSATIASWLSAASGPSPFNGDNHAAFTVARHRVGHGETVLRCRKPYIPSGALPDGPSVSVVIPMFNGARYITETLASLAAQDFQDFEAICADDCSTDATVEIVSKIAAADPRFRIVAMKQNLGSAARVLNKVLPALRGRYMVYSSQDDLFSKDWLDSMLTRIEQTAADAVVPDLVFWSKGADDNKRLAGVEGDRDAIISGREAAFLSLDWRIPGNAMWPTEMVKRVGYEDFSGNSDEYSTRVFFLNCRTVAFSKGTFYYRQDNPEAITKKTSFRTFDFPILYLQLARLLVDHDFDDLVVEKEYRKAAAVKRNLDNWLKVSSQRLTEDHLALIKRTQADYRALSPRRKWRRQRYMGRLVRRVTRFVMRALSS